MDNIPSTYQTDVKRLTRRIAIYRVLGGVVILFFTITTLVFPWTEMLYSIKSGPPLYYVYLLLYHISMFYAIYTLFSSCDTAARCRDYVVRALALHDDERRVNQPFTACYRVLRRALIVWIISLFAVLFLNPLVITHIVDSYYFSDN